MNTMLMELGIGFANPDYAGFLVAWVLVLGLSFATIRWRKKMLGALNVLSWPDAFEKPRWRGSKIVCQIIGLLFLVIALIGPQWGQKEKVVKAEGLDLCFAVDLSRSMLAEDVTPNRLQAAKNQLTIFMQGMGGDRAALVGFAGSAFVAAPLTTDHRALVSFLDPMDSSYISDQSTNLSVGIDACLRALGLDKVKDRSEIADLAAKVVVIVSDGEETGDDFKGAAARAETLGVPVYGFAVGTSKGGLIPIRSERGVEYLKDPSNPSTNVVTKLEEKKLKDIADKTGGKIFYLSGGVEVLKDFNAALANYKRDSIDAGTRLDREDRFQWPLAVAFFFLFLDFLIPELGFAWKWPSRSKNGAKTLVILLAGLGAWDSNAAPGAEGLMPWTIYRNNKAFSLYKKKSYTESRQALEDALSDNARNLMLRYNWASTRLAMSFPQEKGQDFNQKILDETIGEFTKILSEYKPDLPADPFVKGLHYQLALALELKKEREKALAHYYDALLQKPAEKELDPVIEESIRRLLAAQQQQGGGGGGGSENEKKDNKGGEGDKDKKDKKYGQGQQQKPAEFKGTDVNQSQAKKILESVGSKEREVQKRRSQKEAQEKQRAQGQDGQADGRGKQW
ncbi:MAG: VWA domain-containing protein [Bdellovibrionota bacterium]